MSQTGQYITTTSGGVVQTVTADVGVAVPVAGNINAFGGTNINTTAAGNTVTFNLDDNPIIAGTVTADTFVTAGPARTLTITDSDITAGGTDGTVDINLTTAGGGNIVFDGIAAGFTNSSWNTGQEGLQTVGAAPTQIVALIVGDSEMLSIKAYVNGFRDDFSDAIGAEVFVTAYRPAAGNVTLVGAPIINSNTTSTSDVTADVDVGTQTLRILVTGVAAQTFNWVTTYNYFYTITNA